MKTNKFEDFYKFYKFDEVENITFEHFKNNFTKNDTKSKPILYLDYLKQNTFNDLRDNHEEWLNLIYNFFYENPKRFLEQWWNDNCRYDDLVAEDLYYALNKVELNGVINGSQYGGHGRLLKNLYFNEVFCETMKSNTDTISPIQFLLDIFHKLETTRSGTLSPQTFDIIKTKDYSNYSAILRGVCSRASIFNPYTYFYIIQTQLPKAQRGKIFCPVSSWCSPVLALHNLTEYNEMVICDVQKNVIDTSVKLNDWINSEKTFLQEEKKLTGYCCPSEQLSKVHNFHEKYRQYFDTVFFSPPYFDLEIYPGENQSIDNFPTYGSWLEGYWKETVKLCQEVIRPGGTFSFVIVENYGNPKVEISRDMLTIAKDYFTFKETKFLTWKGFDIKGQNHEKRNMVLEHIHILEN